MKNTYKRFKTDDSIAIIGGGITGLVAGYHLVNHGYCVDIYEKEKQLGGLITDIIIGQQKIETLYHHIFTQDYEAIDLIAKLGLSQKLIWHNPHNGIYINNRLYSFSTPSDLLLFPELSLIDRIRFGWLVFKSRLKTKNIFELEKISAKEWVIQEAGHKVYQTIWRPLLLSKFDNNGDDISALWLWNKIKLRGSTRNKNLQRECLGYLSGGFTQIINKLSQKIRDEGNSIYLSSPVNSITPVNNKFLIKTLKTKKIYSKIIFSASPNVFSQIVNELPLHYLQRIKKVQYQANICLLLSCTKPISPYYWLTITDQKIPFVAFIEHTNLFPDNRYQSHIAYLSRYLSSNNPIFRKTDKEIYYLFIADLQKIFPRFDPEIIKKFNISRQLYSQPIIIKNYSKYKPEFITPIKNIYLASMSQIYPEDRGINFAIKTGYTVASIVMKE